MPLNTAVKSIPYPPELTVSDSFTYLRIQLHPTTLKTIKDNPENTVSSII